VRVCTDHDFKVSADHIQRLTVKASECLKISYLKYGRGVEKK
jgi:hypothetical protein